MVRNAVGELADKEGGTAEVLGQPNYSAPLLPSHHFTEQLSASVTRWQKWQCWKGSLDDNWVVPYFDQDLHVTSIYYQDLYIFPFLFVPSKLLGENKVLISGHHLLNYITSCLIIPFLAFSRCHECQVTIWRQVDISGLKNRKNPCFAAFSTATLLASWPWQEGSATLLHCEILIC